MEYNVRIKCEYDVDIWHHKYFTQEIIDDTVTCPDHPSSTVTDFTVIGVSVPFIRGLTWKVNPTYQGIINLLGWNVKTDEGVTLQSGSPITASEASCHTHCIFDVSSISGEPFTIRITGTSIDESTGATTGSDTEDITVSANGYYQSIKSWVNSVQLSIVEGSKSCTLDVYRNTYWDRGNQNFRLIGSRLEFLPDEDTWSIRFKLYQVQDDGSLNVVDDITMSNTDTPARASNGKAGKYKRGDYNLLVAGAEKEGIIVEVEQTNIEYFFLEVKYNE